MSLDHWLFRCIQTMDDPRMNLVPKTDKEKLQLIRSALASYIAGVKQAPIFGWYCELVHDASGEVIRDEFTRSSPLNGPDRVRGFTWRATPLYESKQ